MKNLHEKYTLDESLFEELNNKYILYRGTHGDNNDSTKSNRKVTSIWMTNNINYAKFYSDDIRTFEVELNKIYERNGAPQKCVVETYMDLYKPKVPKNYNETFPFFYPDGIHHYQKYSDYYMSLYYEFRGNNGYNAPKAFKDKRGNTHYEFDVIAYWYVLDQLNAIKAKELGYDALVYNINTNTTEYCILDKACIKKEID